MFPYSKTEYITAFIGQRILVPEQKWKTSTIILRSKIFSRKFLLKPVLLHIIKAKNTLSLITERTIFENLSDASRNWNQANNNKNRKVENHRMKKTILLSTARGAPARTQFAISLRWYVKLEISRPSRLSWISLVREDGMARKQMRRGVCCLDWRRCLLSLTTCPMGIA